MVESWQQRWTLTCMLILQAMPTVVKSSPRPHYGMQSFVLIAHRGNSVAAPENTIEAFDSSIDSGFPHFETVGLIIPDHLSTNRIAERSKSEQT